MSIFKKNTKKKENKKKGFLPWLKDKFGISSRGSMGSVSEGARGIDLSNISKGIGNLSKAGVSASGKAGSSIISALLGKSTIITLAALAVGIGGTLYFYNSRSSVGSNNEQASMTEVQPSNYVPAILKEKSEGSSLDIFKKAASNDLAYADESQNYESQEVPEAQESAKENQNKMIPEESPFKNKPKLQTDMKIGLTSSLGTGSNNKLSALGGFGNHIGKFNPDAKSTIEFKNLLGKKITGMNRSKKAVIAKGVSVNSFKGKGAFGQAKAIKKTQLQPNYGSADRARATMDKAWEGSTGSGAPGLPTSGSGVGSGGAGIVETPSSLDNIDSEPGAYGTGDTEIPDVGRTFDFAPWEGLLKQAMIMLFLSAALAFLASILMKIFDPTGITKMIAIGLALAAIGLGMYVISIGSQISSMFGQSKLGMIYQIGGGLAVAAGGMALAGIAFWDTGMVIGAVLAAAAGIMGLFAAMAAGPASKDIENKMQEKQQEVQEHRNTSYNIYTDKIFYS